MNLTKLNASYKSYQWRILAKWRPLQSLNVRPFYNNNLFLRYRHNFYESYTINKINVFKRKIFVFIFALNFSANKISYPYGTFHTSTLIDFYYEEYQNIEIITLS